MNSLKAVVIIAVLFLNCGAGYLDQLPKLDNDSVDAPPVNNKIFYDKEPVLPLAPKAVPGKYAGIIINNGKYTQYLKDMDELIPMLEDMKEYIESNDNNIQLFSAKTNIINLYIDSMKDRYRNKTERYYESFRQLLSLDKDLSVTANYWRYTYKYNKLIRGSLKDKKNDEKVMRQKLSSALKSINTALEILKENSTK